MKKIALVERYFTTDEKGEVVEIERDEALRLVEERKATISIVDEGETAEDALYQNFHIRTTSIDYCIHEEDVCWQFDNQADLEEDSEEYYDAIHKEIEKIKASLPQEIDLDFECSPDELDDLIVDAIGEETGWLVNSFEYRIIE